MPIGLYTAELNFETIKEIGQEGKNSKVFLAHDKQLDGEIVVKKIDKSKMKNADEYYREAKILYASSHPYVVRVYYGCADNDHIYIAMPYYQRGSLSRLIEKQHLTVREVIRYSVQFLSGLNNIHSKGLLHFDIKPDNILISDSNEALLSDFGLSKAMDSFGFANPDNIYIKQIPPESFSSSEKTIHYDIYLAGLTIYRLLNGNGHYNSQIKFSTEEEYLNAIIQGKFPDRASYLPHIPIKLQRIINKALSVKIEDRHQSVLEFINDLSGIEDNLDWRYSTSGSVSTWSKQAEDRTFEIMLDFSNEHIVKQSCYKTVHASGRKTRVSDHSSTNLTKSNYSSSLKRALREL